MIANRALRFALLGIAVVFVAFSSGCGGTKAAEPVISKPVGDDPATVGLSGVVACFSEAGWSVIAVQGHKIPKAVMATPPGALTPGTGLIGDVPAFWVYPSSQDAAAKLNAVRQDRAKRGGSVPARVGRVIYWWGTTQHPLPETVVVVRKCARSV
jgi:hypothetical protein